VGSRICSKFETPGNCLSCLPANDRTEAMYENDTKLYIATVTYLSALDNFIKYNNNIQ
jgi:hypothetical protein